MVIPLVLQLSRDFLENTPCHHTNYNMEKREKPTQELVTETAEAIWARGERVSYPKVRELLRCRNQDLVPLMHAVLSDPRQKRKASDEIPQAQQLLRKAIATEQRDIWVEQLDEIEEQTEELRGKLASTQTALDGANARIADLSAQLASAKAETEAIRSVSEAQTAPLLETVSGVIRQQTERAEIAELRMRITELEAAKPAAPEIVPCTKWTAT